MIAPDPLPAAMDQRLQFELIQLEAEFERYQREMEALRGPRYIIDVKTGVMTPFPRPRFLLGPPLRLEWN